MNDTIKCPICGEDMPNDWAKFHAHVSRQIGDDENVDDLIAGWRKGGVPVIDARMTKDE